MNNMELTLVFFTVLSQISVGLAVMLAVRQWKAAEGPETATLRTEWLAVGIVLAVGLVVSLFHLGYPGGSPRAMLHLGNSWLSREIVAFQVFGLLVVIGLVALWKEATSGRAVIKIAAAIGLIALAVSGMVYAPPSFPALNNGVPILFYILTAFILGSAFSSYFAGENNQALLARILLVSLIVGLVVNLILPSIWLSGGSAMRLTGEAYFGSSLYWARLVVEFGIGIAVVGTMGRIPVWLPVILLAGEIAGRILFFSHVVHTATTIGGLS
jgi:DMSO reductase anchor subunit